MSVKIVKDSCVNCGNLWKQIEFGSCDCSNSDYAKSSRVRKYRLVDVQKPLKRLLDSANALAEESSLLADLTKSLKEKEIKRCRKGKIAKSKGKARASVSSMERSKAQVSWARRQSLEKADNLIVLGTVDGSIKNGEIMNWIEKRISRGA